MFYYWSGSVNLPKMLTFSTHGPVFVFMPWVLTAGSVLGYPKQDQHKKFNFLCHVSRESTAISPGLWSGPRSLRSSGPWNLSPKDEMWHYILCNTLCSVTGSFIACVGSLNSLQERMVYCCAVQKTAFIGGFLLGFFPGAVAFLELACG